MCSLQLHLAVDKFGSVHVSSPVPDSKFLTKDGYRDQKQCLELFCLLQKGKLAMLGSRSETMWQNTERKVCY